MVIIDETKSENRYADLDDYSTDSSAMMVQTTNNKQVNGITIVEVPGKDKKHITTCDNCQRNKTTNKKAYDKIPLTSALCDNHPWEQIHINCCGPWKIRYENKETSGTSKFEIHLLSMVDGRCLHRMEQICTNFECFVYRHCKSIG